MVLKLLERGADVRYTHKVRNGNFFDFKGTRSTSNHIFALCVMHSILVGQPSTGPHVMDM